jgi:ABC-type sugar transport system ATPase subunit
MRATAAPSPSEAAPSDAEPRDATPAGGAVLEAVGIAKRYGATIALRQADLLLLPGRVHALLGENGAGKSTLVKILVGAVAADHGRILVDGVPAGFSDVRGAVAAGIVPIYQHLSLFPHLSVLENLSAFALGSARGVRTSGATVPPATARAWLDAVGLSCDLAAPVSSLTLGERQLVEIARGLGQRCKVLVLDEPTAALSHDEVERLFAVVRRLCGQGTAVLFISHRFDEIDALCDDVTVLRDGRTVIAGAPLAALSRAELVRAMLGEAVDISDRRLPEPGAVVLSARGLAVHRRAPLLDVDVRAGEIVGLAGLVGSGALEIAAALAGAPPEANGRLTLDGADVPAGSRGDAVALGIGYVPADRHADGLFPVLSARANASASTIDGFARAGFLDHAGEGALVRPWLERMRLHPLEPERAASGFSGGNQQKLVMARNLALDGLRVLVLVEPTRGVDIAARETIHDAIVEAALRGVAVVVASTDLDEVAALSHRVLVVRQGRIADELPRGTSRGALLDALAGRVAA